MEMMVLERFCTSWDVWNPGKNAENLHINSFDIILHQLYPEDTIYIDQVFTYTAVFSSTTTRTGCVVIVVRNNFPPLSFLLKTLSEDI